MEDIKQKIENLGEELMALRKLLAIEKKRRSISTFQLKMAEAGFWRDAKEASKVVEELKSVKSDVDRWEALDDKLRELNELFALEDTSLQREISRELEKVEAGIKKFKTRVLFSSKFDSASAIVEINAGAGGTEACDWAHMLLRMYFRWAEEKKIKAKVLNEVKGEEAGIKNISFLLEGRYAYGLLKSEKGVHRLVRISPFDANRRRHTSFASVDVIPEVEKDINIDIKPEELKIDTFRASGCGGQHVNVTDSAVRITHFSSGIVATCQNERSQYQNKQTAMRVLKAKLYRLKEQQQRKELENMGGKKQKIEWGSQIRSYILYPYLLVKDHRTDSEDNNAWAVLDGKIDKFIYAYLNAQINTG